MKTSQILFPLLLGGALAAQSYVVSPAAYTAQSGNSNNTIPFWSATHRYQQIHGDLKGTPRVILGMSLRKAAITLNTAVARAIDVTILMSNSNFAAASTTFAANYVGTPITVLPKTTVNLPSWTASGGSPEPWSVVIPFTTPFPFPGTNDLLWEWVIDATTATSTYPADAYSGFSDDRLNAVFTNLGAGCIATGNTKPMTQSMTLYSQVSTQTLNFGLSASAAPANAPAAMLVGPVNPNLTVPGLCEKLYSIGLWTFTGSTSANGSISLPLITIGHDLSWVGLKLYAQTVAADTGQPGLPFALTQGREATIPGYGPGASPIQRIWVNSNTATSGSKETYPYGLIVRFTH